MALRTENFTFRLSPDERVALEIFAAQHDAKSSAVVRRALREYLAARSTNTASPPRASSAESPRSALGQMTDTDIGAIA